MEHMRSSARKIAEAKATTFNIENEKAVREVEQEEAFRAIVLDVLIDTFDDHLADAGFSDEDIKAIKSALSDLPYQDALRVFSTPQETSARKFALLKDKVDSGIIDALDIPRILLEEAQRYGFGVGFHSSPHEIRPDAHGRWFIKPTEADHRDGDITRAYFATTYATLYRKGRVPRNLYIVRTIADNTKTDGNWSRSGGMSIIASIPLERVDAYVTRIVSSDQEKKEARLSSSARRN